jgi:hypothetical protein
MKTWNLYSPRMALMLHNAPLIQAKQPFLSIFQGQEFAVFLRWLNHFKARKRISMHKVPGKSTAFSKSL